MGNNAVVIAVETYLLWCLCISVPGIFGMLFIWTTPQLDLD